jgi:hypothetical protein
VGMAAASDRTRRRMLSGLRSPQRQRADPGQRCDLRTGRERIAGVQAASLR